MGAKINHGNGIYSRVCKRTLAGKPLEVYYGRVYVKAERRDRYFRIGMSLRAAQRKMHKILGDPEAAVTEREATLRPTPKPISVEQMIDAFTDERKGYKSRGNSGYYAHAAQSWRKHFGKTDAAKVTRARVEDYRDVLSHDGKSDSTIRSYLTALGTCYRWAKVRGILTVGPELDWIVKGEGVRRPPKPDHEVDVLSRDEEKAALEAADPQTRLLIRLYLASGMRQGGRGDGEEGLALKWSQIDRAGGAILIPKSKTGRARAIPFNVKLTAVLGDVTRHLRSEFVLCDLEGKRLDPWRATRGLESALQRAGIEKCGGSFNLMRHTFGSRMAEAGVPMATIAKIMGNSSAVCERHYIRFSPGHLRAAMATQDESGTVAQDGARLDSTVVTDGTDRSKLLGDNRSGRSAAW